MLSDVAAHGDASVVVAIGVGMANSTPSGHPLWLKGIFCFSSGGWGSQGHWWQLSLWCTALGGRG